MTQSTVVENKRVADLYDLFVVHLQNFLRRQI